MADRPVDLFEVLPAELREMWLKSDARRIADDVFFFQTMFVNISALATSEGLVMIDSGTRQHGPAIHGGLRALTDLPLHTVVFTHGHIDHAFGLEPWLAEAKQHPRIVAHENVPDRFRRYMKTPGYNEGINRMQFGVPDLRWPREQSDFFWPDVTFSSALSLTIGGEQLELRHGRGETDDAAWVWLPERRVLFCGDFWIGVAPNAGNPFKVQRYAEDWADALETMAGLGADLLLPGHGDAVAGRDEIRSGLMDVAGWLRSLASQTLDMLNAGATHDEIVQAVAVPAHFADKPHLRPLYDRPEFAVRNLIRLHGGWWNGEPADLLPSPAPTRAREIAALAGGTDALVERARGLLDTDVAMACHLAQWAWDAEPENSAVLECARDVFRRRFEQETSLMGRSVFLAAVRRAEAALTAAQQSG